jgi:hypothetical protein
MSHLHPRLIFAGKVGAHHSGAPRTTFRVSSWPHPQILRLGWKCLKVTNPLAYYRAKIRAIKLLYSAAPGVYTIILFAGVIINKLEHYHVQPRLILASKAGVYQSRAPYRTPHL